jgi:hypothetical protein
MKKMELPHSYIIKKLKSKSAPIFEKIYSKNFYDDTIFNLLEEPSINNIKGGGENDQDYFNRFKDIISDPNNLFIERVENAGEINDGVITTHNGIKLHLEYYDDFIKILQYNLGVHEPSEERAFDKVLSKMEEGSIMVELGSYWSFYSIWFRKLIKNSISYCIEPDQSNLQVGIRNFELNGITSNFINAKISKNDFNLLEFFDEHQLNKINILHSDIQGYELEMLEVIEPLLINNKIDYLFISTHSNNLHYDCINFLNKNEYKILCSCDYENETFQYDGFILACSKNLNDIDEFYIGKRYKTELIGDEDLTKIIKKYKR